MDLGAAYLTREARARVEIDRQLVETGWVVQDWRAMNLGAGRGVAVREFRMPSGEEADYLLSWTGRPSASWRPRRRARRSMNGP